MGQHALIADPDPARAALYAGILKQEGTYSLVVKDAAAAISVLLERGPPSLAVVDLALGIELIERLRRTAPVAALPIIVVSALRTERDLATVHRVRLGISAILAKAASDESFRRIVRRVLGDVQKGNISVEELAQAKNKIASRVLRYSERPSGRMRAIAGSWMYNAEYSDPDVELARYDAVSLGSIREYLEEYPIDDLTIVGYGPLAGLE